MLERWRNRRRNREIVDRLYEALVARARNPFLYEDGGLPDTVMGRYEALCIEVFLFLRRCRGDSALAPLAQDVVDRFMLDMDHSLREIGIGYQGVPRRMRKLAARFYARVAEFEAPLAGGDEAALTRAVAARSFAEVAEPGGAPAVIATYMIEVDAAYRKVANAVLLTGRLKEEGAEHAA